MTVDDKLVRHCNWVRFLRATDFRQRANIETRRVRGRIVFEAPATELHHSEGRVHTVVHGGRAGADTALARAGVVLPPCWAMPRAARAALRIA